MEVKAIARNTGVSARKIRPIVDMVRGKKVDEALTILKFARRPNARIVAKVVKSAAANAENNFQMTPANLKIASISADQARMAKRHRARSRGQASPIHKRSSHVTVIVTEQED